VSLGTEGKRLLYGTWFESAINTGLANPLEVLRRIGAQGPLAVLVTVLGVQNYVLRTGGRYEDAYDGRWQSFDRDMLVLPDVVVDNSSTDYGAGLHRTFRPIIDAFWQSGGVPKSPWYDAEGKWMPPQG
jgi:hypothetical protein